MSTELTVKGSLSQTQGTKNMSFSEVFLNVEAIILADVSASMSTCDVPTEGGTRSRHEEANHQLRLIQRRFPGRIAVVAFSSKAEFCPDGQLPRVDSNTDMLAALHFVAPADGCGIKYIVVSDGCPDDEVSTLAFARNMQNSIDTIFIGSDQSGRTFMQQLANATKGRSVEGSVDLLEESVTLLLGD